MNKIRFLLTGLLAAAGLLTPPGAAQPVAPQELRGLWVDAFGPGFKTPQQVDTLINEAAAMHVNALFVQVGRRGDCYCLHASMPPTTDPEVPAGFDPLADVLSKAHARGLQVHAWIITTALWNADTPPAQPTHAFNAHGPGAVGRADWLTHKADGSLKSGSDYVMDPGHPDAAEYITQMYTSVVRNYPVDGVQFDRVRYPDGNPVGGPSQWGYNPTALERYRAETGALGVPAADDVRWSTWRRLQVSNLVRRIFLEVKTIRPSVSVNAATITYGEGPQNYAAWLNSRPYQEVLQDWVGWLRGGYLDLNVMMNYKREHVPAQAEWFREWNRFGARVSGNAHSIAGSAIYLNTLSGTLQQIQQARLAGLGWAGYSYRTASQDVNDNQRTPEQVRPELTAKLAGAGGPFEALATPPRPNTQQLRAVLGRVQALSGEQGGREVQLLSGGVVFARANTDGNGYYGFANLPLGPVTVQVGTQSATLTPGWGHVTTAPTLTIK